MDFDLSSPVHTIHQAAIVVADNDVEIDARCVPDMFGRFQVCIKH